LLVASHKSSQNSQNATVQIGSGLEKKRGSAYFLYTTVFLAIAIHVAFFVCVAIGALLTDAPGGGFNAGIVGGGDGVGVVGGGAVGGVGNVASVARHLLETAASSAAAPKASVDLSGGANVGGGGGAGAFFHTVCSSGIMPLILGTYTLCVHVCVL
jgi:hypothetical protein